MLVPVPFTFVAVIERLPELSMLILQSTVVGLVWVQFKADVVAVDDAATLTFAARISTVLVTVMLVSVMLTLSRVVVGVMVMVGGGVILLTLFELKFAV